MPKYFDIHSHLSDSAYDVDREEVIARLKETDTHTIVVGTDFESSQKAVDLANRYKEIYACVGIHPIVEQAHYGAGPVDFEVAKFTELVKHPKVVAIGECGMDFFHADKSADYERQKKLFVDQINFAIENDKSLMIHARPARLSGGGDAYQEILDILTPYSLSHTSRLRGNVHFFAGDIDIARRFFSLGFTISFTGVITFAHDYDEVIKFAPLNMIMSETDSPFVTPVPHRGRRNEPSYISEVVKKIAEIRKEDERVVRDTLVNNALSMIG